MDRIYLDSSALVKQFVEEPGSQAVSSLLSNTTTDFIFIAVVTGPEVVSALKHKEAVGVLNIEQVRNAIDRFKEFRMNECVVLEVNHSISASAMELAALYGLRGYDAIQIARALAPKSVAEEVGDKVTMWSSDKELLAAASDEELAIFDPAEKISAT
jgi:predicted nucleic acid-binding protein